MKSANANEIKSAFTVQSKHFEEHEGNFKNKEYIDYVISELQPKTEDKVLETAAGTGICAREISPFVKSVTCVDLTPAMLKKGKENADKEGIDNITFILGDVNELPFSDNSFDIVLSRLAFHHFYDTNKAFSQMARVLKKGGKFVYIDMAVASEEVRDIEDKIEKMRDTSHVKNLSQNEVLKLFYDNNFNIDKMSITPIKKELENWLDFTNTEPNTKAKIKKLFKNDLETKSKTGFCPFIENGKIYFNQNWLMIIGTKQ